MKFISNLNDDDKISDELFLIRLRYWRDNELKSSDWTQLEDAPVDKLAWAEYRQTLRNLPSSNSNPREIELPERP